MVEASLQSAAVPGYSHLSAVAQQQTDTLLPSHRGIYSAALGLTAHHKKPPRYIISSLLLQRSSKPERNWAPADPLVMCLQSSKWYCLHFTVWKWNHRGKNDASMLILSLLHHHGHRISLPHALQYFVAYVKDTYVTLLVCVSSPSNWLVFPSRIVSLVQWRKEMELQKGKNLGTKKE